MFISRLATALLIAAAASATVHAESSVEDFMKHPLYSTAKISPNGEYLAITVDRGDQDVLAVLRVSDLKVLKINQLPEKKSVGEFHWAGPERLVFNAVRKLGGYAQPFNTGEWFGVNADGSQPKPLIFYGTRDATQRGQQVGNQVFSMADTLKGNDREVIMQSRYPRSSDGAGAELVRLDTYTGRRTSLAKAPKGGCSMSLDENKQPRFAVCSSSRGDSGEFDERSELYRRDADGWTLVNASKSDGKHMSIAFTAADGTVYVRQDDEKAPASIGTLDASTGEFTELHGDPVAEVSEAIRSPVTGKLIAAVTEAGAPKVTMIDEDSADAKLYASLSSSFPGQMVQFSSQTWDGDKIIVSVYSDRNPGELYLFDRDTGQARFLMKRMDWLDADAMATVKPFQFRARDGKTIHGYLTLPKNAGNGKPPLIVNPHGGPIGPRDEWGFNPEAQLFASRGYAVLQVNFRGSGGYGKAFTDAGHKQWGNAIQHDIIDATQWAINQGHVDGNRVCIYGGSFGGYSALMAPIVSPGTYKCAVGYVGVYDVKMMFSRGDVPQRESGLRYLRHTHGTSETGWTQSSPSKRAAEVKIPVLLAAGARDERAPPEQTEVMNKALIAAGNAPEDMIIQSGEMHGFYDVKNRVNLYTKMLAFFDRHLKQGSKQ